MKAITRLRKSIETRLAWGPVENWSNYDFEKLSDEILKATAVNLSVSTLKRFFGKVKYGSSPSVTTLNTLSQFLGFEDWRDFESKEEPVQESKPDSRENPPKINSGLPKQYYSIAGVILLLIVASTFYFQSQPKYNPDDFSFSSKTILTSGLPNSVIFDYEASKVEAPDSVFISQSWDIRRRVPVDKNGKHYSSIYYYPGYFRAKLLAGDVILKEHDIQIITEGWMSVMTAPWGEKPLYFQKEETVIDGRVQVSKELLDTYGIGLFPDLPEIRFYNQKDISGFRSDNFEFETEIKSGFSDGKAACQRVDIYLQGKDDILILPISRPECVGELFLAAFGVGVSSQSEDLSGFGSDLNDWVKVKVTCIDRQISFFINESLAFEAEIPNNPVDIVGVQYRFEGPGAIRNTRLKSGEKEVSFN